MPVYKSSRPGYWRIVVWVKGKRRETQFKGSKAEATNEEAALRLRVVAPEEASATPPTWALFVSAIYAPHAEKHLAPSTWRIRRYQLRYAAELIGNTPIDEITSKVLEEYKRARPALGLDERRGQRKRPRTIGPTGINNELRVIGRVLAFAREQGYPAATPKWKPLPRVGRPRVRVWTAQQVASLYETAQAVAPETVPLLVWLVNTGCRKGEVIACEWSWIDPTRELLLIPSNEVWKPKSGLPREVPLSKTLLALLEEQRGKSDRWVFPATGGGRYASFPKDLYWRARNAAGLVGGVHTTRHTFASHFLARRPDMFLLAQILGHSHQRVTELYSHLLPDHLERARGVVDLAPPKAPRNRVRDRGQLDRNGLLSAANQSSAISSAGKRATKKRVK